MDFVNNNNDEVCFTYLVKVENKSVITRIILNPSTRARQRFQWSEAQQAWSLYSSAPNDYCDNYKDMTNLFIYRLINTLLN